MFSLSSNGQWRLGLILLLLVWRLLVAAESIYEPLKTDAPPQIDGVLDDAVWQKTTVFSALKTVQPDYGKEPSEKTEVRLAYDARHFYFAFRCLDSQPGQIKATVCKRDGYSTDDWVAVVLDTFNDQQSAYMFAVNPLGIQMDGTMNQDGNSDTSLDLVWESVGKLDANGYCAEMAIPLKSIRFPFKKTLTMGLGLARFIGRNSEEATFPAINPEGGAIITQLYPIQLSGLKYERTIELLPALTYSKGGEQEQGSLVNKAGKAELSLTGKMGITSDLTLDSTYNPDFSQVETDASQIDVNLRSAIYYQEKRPFFLEGLDSFNLAARMEASPLWTVVHTRTIVDPLLGFRLTGKVGRRDILAGLFTLDEYPRLAVEEDGNAGQVPNAAVSVLRYKRVLRDDSFVGGFLTDRHVGVERNTLFGSDGRFRLSKCSFLEYNAFYSSTKVPDQADRQSGLAVNLRFNYSNRQVYTEIGYDDIGKNFQTNVGYLTRSGVSMFPLFFMYTFYPHSRFFQRIQPFYWATQGRDKFSGLWESYNLFCLRFILPRQTTVRLIGIVGNEVFGDQLFSRTGWGLEAWTQLVKQLYLEAIFRHNYAIYYDPDDPYPGRASQLSFTLNFQPTDKLNSSFGINFADFYRRSNGEKVYDYLILRNRTTFQLNKYLFFRGIIEYNTYRKRLNLDFLASFTYIPGTVIFAGYGSVYEKVAWRDGEYQPAADLLQTKKSFFFKASYLWRL